MLKEKVIFKIIRVGFGGTAVVMISAKASKASDLVVNTAYVESDHSDPQDGQAAIKVNAEDAEDATVDSDNGFTPDNGSVTSGGGSGTGAVKTGDGNMTLVLILTCIAAALAAAIARMRIVR